MSAWDDDTEQPVYADESIAAQVGMPLVEFWHLAGRDWQRVDVPLGEVEREVEDVGWYATGDPVQAMIGLLHGSSDVLVSRPEGRWRYGLVYVPASPVVVEDLTELRTAIDAVCTARRRTFRWCRYCRQPTPPEYRHEGDICMGCAESVLGVVH